MPNSNSHAEPAESVCPRCAAQTRPVPIVYGMPSYETFLEAEAGELVLGGCVISGEDPQWACPACRKPWPPPRPAAAADADSP